MNADHRSPGEQAHTGQWLSAALAVLTVTLVVHEVAVPAPEVGVAMPAVLPTVVGAGAALLVTPPADAAAVA